VLLLESARAVIAARPRAHFVWLGEGECRAALERRRAALGLESRVHLLGFQPQARALMRQFDVFVLSSYLEGLCTSLLDAQVLGVPIVATAVGGVPEVVRDGETGRLVHGLDAGALAAALIETLARPELGRAWQDARGSRSWHSASRTRRNARSRRTSRCSKRAANAFDLNLSLPRRGADR